MDAVLPSGTGERVAVGRSGQGRGKQGPEALSSPAQCGGFRVAGCVLRRVKAKTSCPGDGLPVWTAARGTGPRPRLPTQATQQTSAFRGVRNATRSNCAGSRRGWGRAPWRGFCLRLKEGTKTNREMVAWREHEAAPGEVARCCPQLK